MAEISTAKCRVDLTPMVDLGFLLITFFVFTTSVSNPVALRLIMPDDVHEDHDPPKVSEEKTLNMLIGEKGVAFYQGNNLHNISFTFQKTQDIRDQIIQHLASVQKNFGNSRDAVILLKPTTQSSYKQLVDCLDEMTINDVKKFMLLEATKEESNRLLIKTQ